MNYKSRKLLNWFYLLYTKQFQRSVVSQICKIYIYNPTIHSSIHLIPSHPSIHPSFLPSIHPSIDRSIDQIDQSINESINQLINQSFNQSINHLLLTITLASGVPGSSVMASEVASVKFAVFTSKAKFSIT